MIDRSPEKGYFGPLLLYFKARQSSTASSGYYLKITLTSEFTPYGDTLGLPLSCKINTKRLPCSYTLNPFEVVISEITNQFTWSLENLLNITTEYQ